MINIYKSSKKYSMVEDIFKLLVKKYWDDTAIWRKYLENVFELQKLVAEGEAELHVSETKAVLSKAL